MNKTLKSILKKIEIHPIELNEGIVEQTDYFQFIENKLFENLGELTFKRTLVTKLIAEQLSREDNYGFVDFSRYKDTLKELVSNLSEAEMSDLLSHHFGGSDKRKFQIIENIEYLSSHNEKINVNFIIDVLTNTIVDEINYEILLVKFKLQNIISLEEWYQFFNINKEELSIEEYDKGVERVNDIIKGVLK